MTLSEHETRFVARIPHVREHRGWTCQQLAERIAALGGRLSRSTLAKVEARGRRIALGEAVLIAQALDVPLGDMCSAEPVVLRVETVID